MGSNSQTKAEPELLIIDESMLSSIFSTQSHHEVYTMTEQAHYLIGTLMAVLRHI